MKIIRQKTLIFLFFVSFLNAQTKDDSAILQLDTTTQGMLIPRMTTVQRDAIANPADGLLIFNTTEDDLNIYKILSSDSSGSWKTIEALTIETYNSAETYNEDDFVSYDDLIWKANQDGITGAFDATKWIEQTHKNAWKSFSDGGSYILHQLVGHEGGVYRNTTGINTDTPPNDDNVNWLLALREFDYNGTEAEIRALTSLELGSIAYASDTQRELIYSNFGGNNVWVYRNGYKVEDYEANFDANHPAADHNGIVALGLDNNYIFISDGTSWNVVNDRPTSNSGIREVRLAVADITDEATNLAMTELDGATKVMFYQNGDGITTNTLARVYERFQPSDQIWWQVGGQIETLNLLSDSNYLRQVDLQTYPMLGGANYLASTDDLKNYYYLTDTFTYYGLTEDSFHGNYATHLAHNLYRFTADGTFGSGVLNTDFSNIEKASSAAPDVVQLTELRAGITIEADKYYVITANTEFNDLSSPATPDNIDGVDYRGQVYRALTNTIIDLVDVRENSTDFGQSTGQSTSLRFPTGLGDIFTISTSNHGLSSANFTLTNNNNITGTITTNVATYITLRSPGSAFGSGDSVYSIDVDGNPTITINFNTPVEIIRITFTGWKNSGRFWSDQTTRAYLNNSLLSTQSSAVSNDIDPHTSNFGEFLTLDKIIITLSGNTFDRTYTGLQELTFYGEVN